MIDAALAAPGFAADAPEKTILVGFGHNTILGVADKVIGAVKAGQLKHFFLIGGCDGAKIRPQLLHGICRSRPEGLRRF